MEEKILTVQELIEILKTMPQDSKVISLDVESSWEYARRDSIWFDEERYATWITAEWE